MSKVLVADYYSDLYRATLIKTICIYLIIWFVSALIWGFVTRKVAENKGYYNDNSFWWGFFLAMIGLIVVLSRPDNRRYTVKPMGATPSAPSESWTCKNCGTQNRLSNTCVTCGYQKSTRRVAGSVAVPNNGVWRCTCGKTNPTYVGTCSCGLMKPLQGPAPNKVSEPQTDTQPINAMPVASASSSDPKAGSKFDEVKSYKELLDAGIISQEDFDKKKAELLGL